MPCHLWTNPSAGWKPVLRPLLFLCAKSCNTTWSPSALTVPSSWPPRPWPTTSIGALPVVESPESHTLVGIITETDIFRLFVEMLGSRAPGVRASLEIDNRKGALASLFNRIVEAGGLSRPCHRSLRHCPRRIRIILKVADVDQDTMRSLLKPEETVIDLREIQGGR